jgi:hypothetical protein
LVWFLFLQEDVKVEVKGGGMGYGSSSIDEKEEKRTPISLDFHS